MESNVWLFIFFVVGLWHVLASIFVAHAARENGRSAGEWVFASLFLSPVFTVLCLIALGMKRPQSGSRLS